MDSHVRKILDQAPHSHQCSLRWCLQFPKSLMLIQSRVVLAVGTSLSLVTTVPRHPASLLALLPRLGAWAKSGAGAGCQCQ